MKDAPFMARIMKSYISTRCQDQSLVYEPAVVTMGSVRCNVHMVQERVSDEMGCERVEAGWKRSKHTFCYLVGVMCVCEDEYALLREGTPPISVSIARPFQSIPALAHDAYDRRCTFSSSHQSSSLSLLLAGSATIHWTTPMLIMPTPAQMMPRAHPEMTSKSCSDAAPRRAACPG